MSTSGLSQHDLVLNAIDVISYRKNRPNIARIYRHLVRFSEISSATCEQILDELVEQGRVMKVTYKGNISYRNAAKWRNTKRSSKSEAAKLKSTKRRSSILSGTIAELVVRVPAYFRSGVPCNILEQHLLSKDGRFTKESIHKLLQKELQQETLVQLDNGNYFLALDNSTSNSTASEDSDSMNNTQGIEEDKNMGNNKDNEIETLDVMDEDNDFDDDDDDSDDLDDEMNSEGGEDDDDEDEDDDDENDEEVVETNNDKEKSKIIELSGESDEEGEGPTEPSSQGEDKDYLPPRNVSISTRRNSTGRMSVRNKKTRFDASEYFFPSLKRTNKGRQEKVLSKQKKHKVLTSKEFKKTLLNPIPSFNTVPMINQSSNQLSTSSTLERNRLPSSNAPSKSVHFGTNPFKKYICGICNDTKVTLNKNSGVRCKICCRVAHTTCAENEQKAAKLQVEPDSWTCAICRSIISQPCSVCHRNLTKTGPLVICGTCKSSYHRSCHKPPLQNDDALKGFWRCSNCLKGRNLEEIIKPSDNKLSSAMITMPKLGIISSEKIDDMKKILSESDMNLDRLFTEEEDQKTVTSRPPYLNLKEKPISLMQVNEDSATRSEQLSTSSSQASSLTPTSSPPSSQITTDDTVIKEEVLDEIPPIDTTKIKEESSPTGEIPDSSVWTTNDVHKYFKNIFGDKVAEVFLKQEIDGNSLKLLRRSDVLRGLGFKLGIGLNVLYHVKMLQLRTSDLKLIWASE